MIVGRKERDDEMSIDFNHKQDLTSLTDEELLNLDSNLHHNINHARELDAHGFLPMWQVQRKEISAEQTRRWQARLVDGKEPPSVSGYGPEWDALQDLCESVLETVSQATSGWISEWNDLPESQQIEDMREMLRDALNQLTVGQSALNF
jgi:hypothetical protein